MLSYRVVVLCLLALFTAPDTVRSEGRVFLFPSTGTDVITVLDADTLAAIGSFTGTNNVTNVLGSADGTKYYTISRTSVDTVVVVDAETLMVTQRLSLGSSASDAEITPDGKYLLVASGTLRVIRTDTEEQLPNIPVGGGPTQIVIDNTSTKAYVLANRGKVVNVIDLATLVVERTLQVPSSSSIALTPNDGRLLVATRTGLSQFRTTDLEEIQMIESSSTIVNGKIHTLPNSTQAVVQNRSTGATANSLLFNLSDRTVRPIGNVGSTNFEEIVVVTNQQAFGILSGSRDFVEIDFTTTPNPSVAVLTFGKDSRDMGISPNKKVIFLSSLPSSTATRVDVASIQATNTVLVPIAPAGHAAVFAPSLLPPAQITVNGGNNQFVPPGRALPLAISVRVLDAEGSPISGQAVLFAAEGSPVEVIIDTPEPSVTNSRGIASAVVTIPEIPPAPEDPPALSVAQEFIDQAESGAEATGLELAAATEVALEPAPVEQAQEAVQPISIAARTAGVEPAIIQVNLIRATGLIKIGGDSQIVFPLTRFPEKFVLLATDLTGTPLPPGTPVTFAAFGAQCQPLEVLTDPNGSASVECTAGRIPQGAGTLQEGSLTAQVPTFGVLGFATFRFTVTFAANTIGIAKISGDGQTGRTDTPLSNPLVFRATTGFGATGNIGIRIRQISGPPVGITPTFLQTFPLFDREINVTLGPNPGNIAILVEAISPEFPSTTFNITATGGQPVDFEKVGDGQSARIGREIGMPLRMRIINETGGVVAFPSVEWSVVQGEATLITASDPDGALARVVMGNTPGPVVVRGVLGSLVATYNLTATAPEPVSISTVSGQNQILAAGEISDPMIVQLNELGNQPASSVDVTFSGPDFVILHPLGLGDPGNPVIQKTGPEGQAGVRVELPLIMAALMEAAGGSDQFVRTISIVATPGGALSTTFVLGTIGRPPSFEPGGLVNAATYQPGIVPGSLTTLFGVGLSEGISGTELAGGATSFNGTTIRIGGIAAPLLSITGSPAEQVNLQIPFELSSGQTTTIEVENNGTRKTVSGVPVFSTQPGIFEIPVAGGGTVGAVIHTSSGQLVSEQNPAQREEVVSMFLTGGGGLSQPVGTGVLGPIPAPVIVESVVVGVDDKGSTVLFSGYAPGFLGLYQVNFEIPLDAGCGVRPLSIRVGGSFSLPSSTVIQCP
jgi:uncharacterized protein (TIGR03437 family)